MSTRNTDRRGAHGQRLDGRLLAARVAEEVTGLQLAHAFVVARSAGFPLRVNKHNGTLRAGTPPADLGIDRVAVNVVNGTVVAGWVD